MKQIIEKNIRHDVKKVKYKVKIKKLKKNNAEISAKNTGLKAELIKLRYDFNFFNLMRFQQLQHITNMQNSCFVREEISKVITVSQSDTFNYVIDQPINGTSSDNTNIKLIKKKKINNFLGEMYKKRISNEIRQMNRKKKLLCESVTQNSYSIIKNKKF